MANFKLLLPKMGESVAEATIIKWLKKPGDYIEIDEPVLEIATDKVDSEVPSPVAGKLVLQFCSQDEVVQVGAVLGVIETSVGQPEQPVAPPVEVKAQEAAMPQSKPTTEPVVSDPAVESPPPVTPGAPVYQSTAPQPVAPVQDAPVPAIPGIDHLAQRSPAVQVPSGRSNSGFYSPLVKQIAAEEKVSIEELERIPGTGADNRLTKDDLLGYIRLKLADPAAFRPQAAASLPVAAEATVLPQAVFAEPTPIPVAPVPAPAEKPVTPPQAAPGIAESPEEVTPQVEAEKPAEAPVEQMPQAEMAQAASAETEEPKPAEPVAVEEPKAAQPEQPEAAEPIIASNPQPPEPKPAPEPARSKAATSSSGGDEIIEMDRMRRLIADHMVMSKHTSPHVTSFIEVDVTALVMWRERVKNEFEKREGEKITFTPIFIEAVVKAIKDMPMINVSVSGTQIIKKAAINIGMATALPNGNLIVPVIKKADELNLLGLTKAVNDLAKRARTGKLQPDDVREGTFTITNVGTFGNVMGTPIINQPQAAILAIGAIKKKPAVIETEEGDVIAIRHMMFLSLSYDHRVVDGSLGGGFIRRVADYLEGWEPGRTI